MDAPAVHARRGIAAVEAATSALSTAVGELDDAAVRAPSLLPGWSRAHVITHLARNADGQVNLLTWARTGVEHPMYPSQADRNAAIEEGSARPHQLLAEDLAAACQRFTAAVEAMPESAWAAEVISRRGLRMPAARVPWLRVREVWVHLIDLDAGPDFGAIPADIVDELLDDAIGQFAGRDDVPALSLHAVLPDGTRCSWTLGGTGEPAEVSGDAVELFAWLTGRGAGTGLSGTLPRLPPWL